jgi:hypothetical protein
MNKITNPLLVIGIIISFAAIITGCYSSNRLSNDPAIRGVWNMQNHASVKSISLVDDGSLLLQKSNDSLYEGQYKTNGNHLLIKEHAGMQDWLDFRYTVRHDSLVLDNGLKRFILKRNDR